MKSLLVSYNYEASFLLSALHYVYHGWKDTVFTDNLPCWLCRQVSAWSCSQMVSYSHLIFSISPLWSWSLLYRVGKQKPNHGNKLPSRKISWGKQTFSQLVWKYRSWVNIYPLHLMTPGQEFPVFFKVSEMHTLRLSPHR